MRRALLISLLAVLLIAADKPKKDLDVMQGSWAIVSGQRDGKELGVDEIKTRRVVIAGNRYTVYDNGRIIDQGTFSLDTKPTPRTIDIQPQFGPNAGKKLLGIYQVEGDDRVMCYGPPGTERPKEFASTPENKMVLLFYKREKGSR